MVPALYVHIPFCTRFCPYCDFPKAFYRRDWVAPYLESLFRETKTKALGQYETIYLGGGTPTCLLPEDLERVLAFFSPYLVRDGEFSIECNPDTLSQEKIALLAKYGVNRVSLGVQSFHPKYRALLTREGDEQLIREKVGLLKEAGIKNINLDIMFALPGETVEEAKEDIVKAMELGPTHISAYSLILEENTPFAKRGILEASNDEQADQYEAILSALESGGYRRYEVSNFAMPGYECKHNLHYWADHEYDAVGLGAAGHRGNKRYTNTKVFPDYLAHKWEGEVEELSRDEERECFFLSYLRLTDGFPLQEYEARFGSSFLEDYGSAIDRLEGNGLLEVVDDHARATRRGLLLLDAILLTLF